MRNRNNTHSGRGFLLRLVFALMIPVALSSAGELPVPPSPVLGQHNKAIVQAAFNQWRAGTGGVFDLLAPDAQWEIVGTSMEAGIYHSRKEFMEKVITPFNARTSKPLFPTVREMVAEGDEVVVLFDANTIATDGQPYANTYAWFLQLKDDQIVKATAFFDTVSFNQLWTRVQPVRK